MLQFAADLQDRLAGPYPDSLAQLVAERVVVNSPEDGYEAILDKLITLPAQFKLFMAQIELANGHLLSACRTLAKAKRAKLPDVLALINVAAPVGGAADDTSPARAKPAGQL